MQVRTGAEAGVSRTGNLLTGPDAGARAHIHAGQVKMCIDRHGAVFVEHPDVVGLVAEFFEIRATAVKIFLHIHDRA